MARYIDELESPMVGAHFDVGNVVNFGWPEQWIPILGKRIMNLDIKEYSWEKRDREASFAGFQVPLGKGDCDWPVVQQYSRRLVTVDGDRQRSEAGTASDWRIFRNGWTAFFLVIPDLPDFRLRKILRLQSVPTSETKQRRDIPFRA
tara:strand:+ start:148 stop:588 length:441 start_codon:yes stop_codon:yes gene_type:complete